MVINIYSDSQVVFLCYFDIILKAFINCLLPILEMLAFFLQVNNFSLVLSWLQYQQYLSCNTKFYIHAI